MVCLQASCNLNRISYTSAYVFDHKYIRYLRFDLQAARLVTFFPAQQLVQHFDDQKGLLK